MRSTAGLARATTVFLAAAVLAVTGLPSQPASATVTPAWQPDANDLGDVQFFNAAGTEITSGSISASPMAAYYKLPSGSASFGHVATSTPETSNSATWNGTQQITSDQSFPQTGLPGSLAGFAGPVIADDSGKSFQQNQINGFPNALTTAGYQNLYEVRFYVDNGQVVDTTHWYAADILVDPQAGTWTKVYPAVAAGPAATTTTLAASPAASAPVGSPVQLTATVSPANAGSVTFKDGGSVIAAGVAVSGGQAVTTTSALGTGSHDLTAEFTPSDSGAFSASTSTVLPYTITAITKTTPTVVLAASPVGSAYFGTSVTLTATTQSGVAGSVQFAADGTDVGNPVTVAGNQAQVVTSILSVGTHALTAAFTPGDTANYNTGASNTVSYAIKGAPSFIPTVYGTHKVGATDVCVASSNDATATRATVWRLNGVSVGGAATYRIPDGALGKKLTCAVTFTNAAGAISGTSPVVSIGLGAPLRVVTKPHLNGSHVHGAYEYVYRGTWTPTATAFSYQWYVGTTKISGATSYRLLISRSWIGKYVYCVVIAKRAQYANGVYKTAGVKITS